MLIGGGVGSLSEGRAETVAEENIGARKNTAAITERCLIRAQTEARLREGGVKRTQQVSSGLDAGASLRLKATKVSGKRKSMEIHLDRRAVRHIRLSAQEAIEEDDIESLREDILEAFTEDQVEEIERRLDNADFFEFLTEVLDEWGGDDVDELFELLETQLGEVGLDIKIDGKEVEGEVEVVPEAEEEEEAEEEDEEFDVDEEEADEDEDFVDKD